MPSALRTIAIGIALLLLGSSCSPPARSARSKRFEPFALLEAGRDSEAQAAIASLSRRYSTCRAYADRGTAILTRWSRGERFTRIGYFRTEFVRGRVFKFRFYEETGALNFGIWASGSDVRIWFDGKETDGKSLDDAIVASRGITSLSSRIVPTLLFGKSICASRVALAGEEYVTCGNCSIISIEATGVRQQLISVDVDQHVLRRFRDVAISAEADGGKRAASERTDYVDDLLTYEPSFDEAAEAQFGPELERPAW